MMDAATALASVIDSRMPTIPFRVKGVAAVDNGLPVIDYGALEDDEGVTAQVLVTVPRCAGYVPTVGDQVLLVQSEVGWIVIDKIISHAPLIQTLPLQIDPLENDLGEGDA